MDEMKGLNLRYAKNDMTRLNLRDNGQFQPMSTLMKGVDVSKCNSYPRYVANVLFGVPHGIGVILPTFKHLLRHDEHIQHLL